MFRRLLLTALALLLLAVVASPASAESRRHASRHGDVTVSARSDGSVIVVTYIRGPSQRTRLLHAAAAIERVAVRDVDNDGDLDVLAAPREGRLLLWRNAGHGRFSLVSPPRTVHPLAPTGLRFERVHRQDDGWQWGAERYDVAVPRTPAVVTVARIAILRLPLFDPPRRASQRPSSGRAPPLA